MFGFLYSLLSPINFLAQRAGVEPARHSTCSTGFQPVPVGAPPLRWSGWPFRCLLNASTRTRTQNTPLEAEHDFHFTIEAAPSARELCGESREE